MGCCGKRRSASKPPELPPVPKGLLVPTPAPPKVVRETTVAPVAPPVNLTRAPERRVPADGLNILLITQQGTTEKHSCGMEIVLQHRFSQRLRRYFDVKYCPACKADVGSA